MTATISAPEGSNMLVNGIRCQLVADVATGLLRELTDNEASIAKRAGRLVREMRSSGYSKEHTRAAVWSRILDEAQRVTAE